jgi:C-terminal peptidase prc
MPLSNRSNSLANPLGRAHRLGWVALILAPILALSFAALSLAAPTGCSERRAGEEAAGRAAANRPSGEESWRVADHAEREAPFAVALYGGNGRGVLGASASASAPVGDRDDDDLSAQEPEGYALRGRAAGEGHDRPGRTALVAEVEIAAEGEAARPGADGRQGPRDARAHAQGKDNLPPGTPKKDDGDGNEDGEDEKGYWRDVRFSREQFEDVRRFVRLHYIEDDIDEKRSFVEAANFALLSLEAQPLEIVPESFYELRKGHPDEDGRLKGKTFKLRRADRFLLHEIPKDEKEPKRKRLSDDEIRQLRLREKARFALLERHWNQVPFDESDFVRLIAAAVEKLPASKGVREDDLWIAAAQGYLYSLDPHSALVSAKAWDESTQQTEDSSFDGIGAVLTQRDEQTIVESPIEGQPAVRAGLRAGDVILMVDDKEVAGLPLFKVVKRIRGPRGTPVVLTIRRLGVPDDLKITITRAHIDIKNVSGHLMEPPHEDIGYIKMTGFVKTSADKFDAMIAELTRKTKSGRLRGLVFDLRNDNGGLLSQGIAVADRFLTHGDIVSVRNKAGGLTGITGRDEVYQATPDRTVDIPVVVLVNDATASAAEIVASALQENRRALVVGERTFGKASVQTLYPPPGQKDYYIKLTVARYYSPTGRTIQLMGVQPDVEVPPDVGGEMPLGFREENLRNPLPEELAHYRSPMAPLLPTLEQCVLASGRAEKLHEADPNPAIKFDYQLMKGADYLECMISTQSRSATQN